MEFSNINHLAVLLCAALNLALGALWYSPVMFYDAWKKENGLNDIDFEDVNFAKLYTLSFSLALIMSYNLAFFLSAQTTDWLWGLTAGFLAGFGWCAPIFIAIALFEKRSWRYIAINATYIVLYFSMIGFILGVWR